MPEYKILYCNTPAAMHLPGKLVLMPGPDGNKIPIATWESAKKKPSVQRAVRSGQLTGETAGYRPMIAKRPRKVANTTIDLDNDKTPAASRRAREPMVVGGAPDRDLIAEIEGMPTSTEIALSLVDLQERAAAFDTEMSARETAIRAEADERVEAERKAADERLEALRAETERELATMRARIEAMGVTPTPPDPTPVPDEPGDEGTQDNDHRAGRRRRG
jgi:hypothetical protein